MRGKIIFWLAFIFLLNPICATAAITITNGIWVQSFDCAEWTADYPSTLDCNGMEPWLNNCAGEGVVPCAQTPQSMGEQILESANNPSGVPGTKAQVHYFYTGIDGSGSTNDRSGSLHIRYPTHLQEFWFRFYVYYPSAYGWGGAFNGWKTLYGDNSEQGGWYFGFPRGRTSTGFYLQAANQVAQSSGYGDDWLEANSRQGFDRWIPVEIHLKLDTNGTDGVVQTWVDDVLIIDEHNKDFGLTYFSDLTIGSNGDAAVGVPNTCMDIRFDDMALATTAYNAFVDDGNGNPRIGLLNRGSSVEQPLDVAITLPVDGDNYATSNSILELAGSASDDSVIESVTWSNDRGGDGVGAGTTSWTIDNINLYPGQNIVTVMVQNVAGQTATDVLTIEYSQLQGGSLILFEDWEGNSTSNWDDDFIQGDNHIDTTPVFAGNYAMKMESSNWGQYVHFFGDHPGIDGNIVTDVTVEEYYYPPSNFDWVTGLKLWIMNSFESWYADYSVAEGQAKPHSWAPYYMTISANGNGEPYGQLSRADGLGGTGVLWQNFWQNVGQPVSIVKGQWNKLKFRLKLNTLGVEDGVFQLWLDDQLICNYTNVNFRGTYSQYGWNHLMMSMHANPAPTVNQWISRDNIHIFSGDSALSILSAPASFQLQQ